MIIDGRRSAAWGAALLLLSWSASGCKPRREPVLAKVGKLAITEPEFQRRLAEVTPEYQNYVLTPNGRRQFLDILIRQKMILSAATDAGMQKTPEFKAQMDRLKAEEAERVAEGRDYLVTQLWLSDLRRKGVLSVSEEEVRHYHQSHPNEVQVRHILLSTPEEAEVVLKMTRSGGNRFASIAQTKSLDADTAASGGKMSPAIYGEIIPELEDVVFRSKVGEIVGPVKSKFGYHILRKETEKPIAFPMAEERVRRVLEKAKLDEHLRSLQSRYHVEVLDAQFN
ncbi:MAG: peptidylprolyl isomerase [Elusimicrobia bacterium]|nr:peptidylprolyl isomerase [Elusimicrobiota bacterium]